MHPPDDLPKLPVTFYTSRLRMVFYCAGNAVVVMLGFYIYSIADTEQMHPALYDKFWAIAAIIFSGFLMLMSAWRIMQKKAEFSLSSAGITYGKNVVIPWQDIAAVKLVEVKVRKRNPSKTGPSFVGVFLKDTEKYYALLSNVQRNLSKINAGITGTPVNLNTAVTGIAPEKLLGWLEYYLTKSQVGL